MASIQGRIVEYWTRRGVQGAVVQAGGRTAVTGASGGFSLEVPLGVLTVKVTHPQFHDYTSSLNITAQQPFNIGEVTMQSKVRAL